MQGDLAAWLHALAGSDEEFVERAWQLVLRRPPEPEGRTRALEKLRDGTLSRAGLLAELVGSDEFARVVLLDAGLAFAAGERARPPDHRGPPPPRAPPAPAPGGQRAVESPRCPPPHY